MLDTAHLIAIADAYKLASGIDRDQTASYRIFGDSKKLSSLREGGDITVARFNASLDWLRVNWPEGHNLPEGLMGGVHTPAHVPAPAAPQDPPPAKAASVAQQSGGGA